MLGKLDIHMQKNEIEQFALWHTQKSTQNQLKWLTHKTGNYKTRRKHKIKSLAFFFFFCFVIINPTKQILLTSLLTIHVGMWNLLLSWLS